MYIEKTTTRQQAAEIAATVGEEESIKIVVDMVTKLSKTEMVAAILMVENQEMNDWLLSTYSRDDFMEALEVLERVKRKFPDDEECSRAIEFIRENFQQEGGLNRGII